MTDQQKNILAILAVFAVFIFGIMGSATAYLIYLSSNPEFTPQPVAQQPTATPLPTPSPTSTPIPSTNTPIAISEPSPTPTKVVVVTVLPTPTPTIANCIDNIRNFEESKVITDNEVQQYILDTIPLHHLDHCRNIEYVHIQGQVHSIPIAGNIIPVYRKIFVYSIGSLQNREYLLDTLVHEIGHNVHFNFRRNNFDLDVRWAELYRQSQDSFAIKKQGFVSDYARTNKFEDFAESYETYVRNPRLLIAYNPDKYEFLRVEIFNEREY